MISINTDYANPFGFNISFSFQEKYYQIDDRIATTAGDLFAKMRSNYWYFQYQFKDMHEIPVFEVENLDDKTLQHVLHFYSKGELLSSVDSLENVQRLAQNHEMKLLAHYIDSLANPSVLSPIERLELAALQQKTQLFLTMYQALSSSDLVRYSREIERSISHFTLASFENLTRNLSPTLFSTFVSVYLKDVTDKELEKMLQQLQTDVLRFFCISRLSNYKRQLAWIKKYQESPPYLIEQWMAKYLGSFSAHANAIQNLIERLKVLNQSRYWLVFIRCGILNGKNDDVQQYMCFLTPEHQKEIEPLKKVQIVQPKAIKPVCSPPKFIFLQASPQIDVISQLSKAELWKQIESYIDSRLASKKLNVNNDDHMQILRGLQVDMEKNLKIAYPLAAIEPILGAKDVKRLEGDYLLREMICSAKRVAGKVA